MLQKGIWEGAAEIMTLRGDQKIEQVLGSLIEKFNLSVKQLFGALNLSLLFCKMVLRYKRECRERKLG